MSCSEHGPEPTSLEKLDLIPEVSSAHIQANEQNESVGEKRRGEEEEEEEENEEKRGGNEVDDEEEDEEKEEEKRTCSEAETCGGQNL